MTKITLADVAYCLRGYDTVRQLHRLHHLQQVVDNVIEREGETDTLVEVRDTIASLSTNGGRGYPTKIVGSDGTEYPAIGQLLKPLINPDAHKADTFRWSS